MDAMNATIPPNNTNPTAPSTTAAAAATREHQHLSNGHSTTHATTGAHTTGGSKMEGIRSTLHDIKDSVKETLQRDHHHGADCAKKPQDGKTNPME